jgi:hypothetical protein
MAWRTHLRTVSAVPTPSRRATLIADAPMFGQRWPGKIGRKYSCRRRLWDSNCRRSCRQDSPQIEGCGAFRPPRHKRWQAEVEN